MHLIFLGTPQFAVPSLDRIVQGGHNVSAVFTQPDRPKGRGGAFAMSPVKEAALRLNIPIHQPERIRRPEPVELLRQMQPDAMVVVGYGQIIPQSILDIPPHGIINVHASLLPKYRGAAPIQWAIANGESATGVTTMKIDAGLDTGDMLLKWSTQIGPEENALELSPRLAEAGAELLIQTLNEIASRTLRPEQQDSSQATLAPILKKEDGQIDWSQPAITIFNRSRGLLPWPGTFTYFRGQLLHLWRTRPSEETGVYAPGVLMLSKNPGRKKVLVQAGGATMLELLEVQIEGRKRISGESFLNGQRLSDNEILGVRAN